MGRDRREKDSVRKEVTDEIFFKPALSLLPAFVGLPLALAPWVLDKPLPLAAGIGLGLTLLSVGLYATRVALAWGNAEGVRKKILDRRRKETEEALRRAFRETRERLLRDGDSRTEAMFDRLIALRDTLAQETAKDIDSLERTETIRSVEELVTASVRNLEESAVLAGKATATHIDSLREITEKRRTELIEETRRSIAAIEKILLAFIRNRENYSVAESARIREDLESQLEISKRVKERMQDWQAPEPEIKIQP